ncbi:MAG: hypothetical protein LAT51_11115 [Flavobacteriaceae bacterium]|nr:hypothetical protein [Flavobacteriaceae bacterium]
MKNFIIFTLTLVFFSCSSDDDITGLHEAENAMSIIIDNQEYISKNEMVTSNENCERLYVNTYFYKEDEIYFRFRMHLSTSGELLYVWYDERDLSAGDLELIKIFMAPNFNPTKTFNISNFEYDKATGDLAFDFSGTVFWENDNSEYRDLEGNINIASSENVNCDIAIKQLTYYSNELNLYSDFWSVTQHFNNSQTHRFITNNGFILQLHVASDLWDLSIGEYEFNEDSETNFVSLKEQHGDIIATQTPIENQHEWLNYLTSGKIILDEKFVENDEKIIAGRVYMDVSLNDEIVYSINGLKFSVGSTNN